MRGVTHHTHEQVERPQEPAHPDKEELLRRVEFVRQCETLAETARAQATLAAEARPIDLWTLPLAAKAAEETARGQAEAYESWAEHAAPWDALLARALHDMAASLQETARQAAALTQQAADFVRFEEEEAAGH